MGLRARCSSIAPYEPSQQGLQCFQVCGCLQVNARLEAAGACLENVGLARLVRRAEMDHGALAVHDPAWGAGDAGAPDLPYALMPHADPKHGRQGRHMPHQGQ